MEVRLRPSRPTDTGHVGVDAKVRQVRLAAVVESAYGLGPCQGRAGLTRTVVVAVGLAITGRLAETAGVLEVAGQGAVRRRVWPTYGAVGKGTSPASALLCRKGAWPAGVGRLFRPAYVGVALRYPVL